MTAAGSVVDFFVRYAESEGALTETIPEGALLMLPQELGRSLGIPEELSLTEDPEVAREDGFVLVSPGDPLVRSTAETVLRRGDVGCSRLAWPQGLPPTPAAMEQLARAEIQPDHGRVDVVGAPTATHVMLLRVGALVTYSVSIDEQVQEVEEAWVVAASGLDVPPPALARLGSAAVEPGLPVVGVRWDGEGVGAADLRLRERALRRCGELARQTSARLASQLAVVDDYYQRVLESIEERRARAGEDRIPMLTAQADATRGEWARRRAEVADDLTPSFELLPFRLHLLAVPAYRVAVLVRRGPRAFELTLTFLPLTSSYLPPPCPACLSVSTLVAGKDRLGCRSCLSGSPVRAPSAVGVGAPEACLASPLESDVGTTVPPPAGCEPGPTPAAPPGSSRRGPARAPAASRGAAPDASRLAAGGARGASAARSPAARCGAGPRTAGGVGAPDPPARQGRGSSKRRPGRVTPKGGSHDTLSRTGMRLATSFWESVLEGERVKQRDVLEHSPLAALLRLYGRRGPSLLVGLHEDELPVAVATSTLLVGGRDVVTAGDLRTSMGREVAFALRWRPDGRPRLVELESFPLERMGLFVGRSDELGKAWRKSFEAHLGRPPLPEDDLDEVESVLLQRAGCFAGLAYAARCLAARWYLVGDGEGGAGDRGRAEAAPSATAAAVEVIVARRLGWRLTTNAAADRYRCGLEEVRAEVRCAQRVLGDDPDAGW